MSNVVSADVSDDLYDRIEAEQEEGESRSATVRRLVRRGLDADRHPVPTILTIIGASVIGIAIEPVAPPELFVGLGIAVLALAAGVERGLFSRSS